MSEDVALTPRHYAAIATFRHQLRRFLAFSEKAAAEAGLPAQQHQALLVIAGHRGPGAPTVGTIAQQLIVAPHTAAELVARMVMAGLLTKTQSVKDSRKQELALTERAAEILHGLTKAHLRELDELREALAQTAGMHLHRQD